MYRKMRDYENAQHAIYVGVGEYGIPQIWVQRYETACKWVGFNEALSTAKPKGRGVHFFIDDYQFKRVWTAPERYIEVFKRFDYVMTPDFSTYTDFPKALQIYNHYRKHWVGAYMQENGVNIIPSISWSDEASFSWCFDGEPIGGAVAVSSVGCMKAPRAKALFLAGYAEMLRRLEPETVLFYGEVPRECAGNIVQIAPFYKQIEQRKGK